MQKAGKVRSHHSISKSSSIIKRHLCFIYDSRVTVRHNQAWQDYRPWTDTVASPVCPRAPLHSMSRDCSHMIRDRPFCNDENFQSTIASYYPGKINCDWSCADANGADHQLIDKDFRS